MFSIDQRYINSVLFFVTCNVQLQCYYLWRSGIVGWLAEKLLQQFPKVSLEIIG